MTDFHCCDIDTARGSFHVCERGAADAPVIVLLHGWPQSNYCWRPLAEHLPDHYRLVMPDLRGLGDSPRTLDDSAYTKQALGHDIVALLDSLRISSCVLVGHDWGGAVAQEVALAETGRISQLVLLNIPVITNIRGNQRATRLLRESGGRSFWYQHFQSAPELPEAMIPGNERAWLGYFLRTWSESGFPEDAFAEYVRCYAIEHTPATGAAYYRVYKQDMQRWSQLAGTRLATPTLYIHGRHDPVIIPAFTEHLDDVFDNVRLESLDAAHFVAEEQPEAVATLIRGFIE